MASAKSSQSRTKTTTFKKDQQVVYPLQGVGQIQTIEERVFKDKKILYYIIYLEVSDMTVMIPVDKAEEIGIRAIVSKKEAENALDFISEEFEPAPTDWKLRYQMNMDLLKQGSVVDIARVVRTLYHRSKVKELPILERKLFDSALRLLVDEVAFAMDITKGEAEQLIFAKLELELAEKQNEAEEEPPKKEDDYEEFEADVEGSDDKKDGD